MTKEELNFRVLTHPERSRTYLFGNGEKVTFGNVTAIGISKSGSHRLCMADGSKAIVQPDWIAILLDVDEWSF